MPETFPEVRGGGSLILAWQVRNKKVLVVGGGEVRLSHSHLVQCEIVDINTQPRSQQAAS